jgi:hypothetical protein
VVQVRTNKDNRAVRRYSRFSRGLTLFVSPPILRYALRPALHATNLKRNVPGLCEGVRKHCLSRIRPDILPYPAHRLTSKVRQRSKPRRLRRLTNARRTLKVGHFSPKVYFSGVLDDRAAVKIDRAAVKIDWSFIQNDWGINLIYRSGVRIDWSFMKNDRDQN